MKTFKWNTQILIICCGLIVSGASTPQKYIGSDGREYLIDDDYNYNWFEASHECARRNMQLLTIDSAEKQNVIDKLLNVEPIVHLWMGGNDEFKSNVNGDRPFFWSSTGKQFTYFNWQAYHPLDGEHNQHCVLIWSPNKKCLNYECYHISGFICEEKQLMESSNKNSNNASDGIEKFVKDFDLKFLNVLKDNMIQLNGQLKNIKQLGNDTKYEVDKLTNITQNAVEKILNEQAISTKELNHEITKQESDLNDQLKRYADELNEKFSDKQNFTSSTNNIVIIQQTG